MAVYRIFPEKSSFIYTEQALANSGKDEILEIGGYPVIGNPHTSRTLVQFSTTDIQNIVDNNVGALPFTANLNIPLATAYEIPAAFAVYGYPVYDSWENGVGKYGDSPINKTGVSWNYPTATQITGSEWTAANTVAGVAVYTSGSYTGGGSWYTGSNGIDLESVNNYTLNSNLDINLDVTNATLLHYSGSIGNNGYIIKLQDDLEFSIDSITRLKYYSADTGTIYPPSLEIKWDDSIHSSSLDELTDSLPRISVSNMREKYLDEGKQRFRITARPTYPARSFVTSSVYLTNYKLPVASYWGIKDEYTQEMVIPFDTNYTKISADDTGGYFDVYMGGLEPERFYRLLVKTEIDGSTVAVDTGNTFKVVQDGHEY